MRTVLGWVIGAVFSTLLLGCQATPSLGVIEEALTRNLRIQRGTGGVVADASISASAMNRTFGTQPTLQVRAKREALLRFDVSAIPANAVINSATLTLFLLGDDDEDNDDCDDKRPHVTTVTIQRATAPWVENTVTYATFGQHFDASVAATISYAGQNATKAVDVKTLVQAWVGGTRNDGMVLRTNSGKATFASSEAKTLSLRPALAIVYTVPDDHCSPNPCLNAGACQNGSTGYTCTCAAGFSGASCENDINECAGSPCQNGGACTNGTNTYTCACIAGYTGANCETLVDNCAPNPCNNGGICTNQLNGYACACAPGFTGTSCETLVNNCASTPCLNGGSCTNGVNSYTCGCAAGFTGANCQINTDDCVGNQCQNGATCVDGVAQYTCSCAPGYSGTSCEILINNCANAPCLNGGTCVNGVNSYTCGCAPGFSGAHCEIDINECAAAPCQHGGSCVDGINAFSCTCDGGYSGATCELAPLLATTGLTLHPTQSLGVDTLIATFVSDREDMSGTSVAIDWGDGSSTTGTFLALDAGAGLFGVLDSTTGGHVYRALGTYDITVTIHDPDSTSIAHATALVDTPELVIRGTTIHATQGTAGEATLGAVTSVLFPPGSPFSAFPHLEVVLSFDDGRVGPGEAHPFAGMIEIDEQSAPFGGHLYATLGTHHVTITVTDADNRAAVAVAESTIIVDRPQLSATGLTYHLPQGAGPNRFAAATFTNAQDFLPMGHDPVVATIDWGDGHPLPDSASLLGSSGTAYQAVLTNFSFVPHTYRQLATYDVTVAVSDTVNGASATAHSTAIVDIPELTTTGLTFHATRGIGIGASPLATFHSLLSPDTSPRSLTLDVSIDWGDGLTSPGSFALASGSWEVTDASATGHAYATTGTFPVSITLRNPVDGVTALVTSTAIVDTPTTATPGIAAYGVTFDATRTISYFGIVGSFNDSNLADTTTRYALRIDWGDGLVSTGTAYGRKGTFWVADVSAQHQYVDVGTFPVTVTLREPSTGVVVATAHSTGNVRRDVVAEGLTFHPTVDVRYYDAIGVLTSDFNNISNPYHSTVDWGDGTAVEPLITSGSYGLYVVSSDHTYTTPGTYPVAITVLDATNRVVATTHSTAIVDPYLFLNAQPLQPVQGVSFTSLVGGYSSSSDSFTSRYGAIIDWGDSTSSAASVLGRRGNFSFSAGSGHAYRTPGTYPVALSLIDPVSHTMVASSVAQAVVTSPVQAAGMTVPPIHGVPFRNAVASFTTANPLDTNATYTAAIDWGDGSSTTGRVVGDRKAFAITDRPVGAHVYATSGTYSVTTSITDVAAGTTTVAHSTAIVQ